MSDHAYQVAYRDEFIAQFEQRQSLLRQTVTTEAMIKGQQATFLVAGSNHADAVTRGLNGNIPARYDDLNQYTATLVEWHDLVKRTSFNIFASQGDGKRIMQQTTMGVLNRRIDEDILTELASATNDTGSSATASVPLVMYAQTILGNNEVPMDGNISAVISPAFYAYLMQTKEFTNIQWVNDKPFESGLRMFRWANVNWIVHPNISGKGTNAEKCFMYHKDAIGHAANIPDMQSMVDYNREQDYTWARASAFMGSKILQNSGIVVMNHDGSQLAAQ